MLVFRELAMVWVRPHPERAGFDHHRRLRYPFLVDQHIPAAPIADARELRVQFDEGGLEVGHGRAREVPPDERGGNR